MFATILAWLGSFLGGPLLKGALDAYKAKLANDNSADQRTTDLLNRELAVESRERELQAQIITSEQGRWYTALPRPMFAYAIVILVWKLVVWDTVLGWGTTGEIPKFVSDWSGIIITAYFGGRSLEKAARYLGRK